MSKIPTVLLVELERHTCCKIVGEVSAALGAGADGYCSKDAPIAEIVKAMDAVRIGQVWLDPLIAEVIVEKNHQQTSLANFLTPLEVDLLNLIKEGMEAPEIANRLNVTTESVSRLMHKIINQFVKQPLAVTADNKSYEPPKSRRDSDEWLRALVENLQEGKTFAGKYLLLGLLGEGGGPLVVGWAP